MNLGSGHSPTASYSSARNTVYIYYLSGGYIKCMALHVGEGTLVGPYSIVGYTTGSPSWMAISSTPYAENIGVLYSTLSTNSLSRTDHAAFWYPWAWVDNANNWTWNQNNTMPYIDDIQMAVDGTLQLEYEPDSIIEGTTLPDEENNHDATITWGANPSGVTATLSVLQPETEEETPPIVVPPGEAAGPDVVGPTGQPGWTGSLPTLASNPLYPAVLAISTETSIPVGLVWIIGATFLLILAMLMCFKYVPHQIITVLVGGGLAAFFYHVGIYPFWVIFIFAVMGIAVIVGERTPTV